MVVQSRNTYFIFFIETKWAETLLLVTKIELTFKLYSLVLGLHSDDTRGDSPGCVVLVLEAPIKPSARSRSGPSAAPSTGHLDISIHHQQHVSHQISC